MTLYSDSQAHLEKVVMDQTNIVTQRLENGGSPDMNVDGTTPVIFKAVPPANKYWMIARLMIYFSGGTPFSEELFGNLTALTNGISVLCNNVEIINWKDNMDVQTSMFDAEGKEVYALVNRSISGRMSFTKFGSDGKGLRVDDNTNGIGIKIQDASIDGLQQFRARVQGVQYDKITA
jgi:hypothetical protein